MQKIKKAMQIDIFQKDLYQKCDSIDHKLDNFLFNYRNTPSTVTMKSPAKLLFKQIPKTKLKMFHPNNLKGKVERKRGDFSTYVA